MSSSVQLPHGGCHTHRTPSGAGRSAAWPRTPTGSTRRCATSWGLGGGRLRAAGRWARADERASGRALAARPGLQRREPGAEGRWGGMGDGRPSVAPPGGGAALGGHHRRPDRPSSSLRPTERGRMRAAGRPYPLIAPESRGRGARRPRRRPDALPWRTPRACVKKRGGAQGRSATTRPSSPPARGALCPGGLQITSPGSRSCSFPGPLPLQQLITESPHRSPPPRRGGSWEMESRAQ